MRSLIQLSALALFAGVLLTTSSALAQSHAALGSFGDVYVATSGLCSDLLTDCAPAQADHPIVVIDMGVPGETPSRLLVPGTLGPEAEGEAALLFEDRTESLYVVYESRSPNGESRVHLTWFRNGQWSSLIEVTGAESTVKGKPLLSVTRDSFHLDEGGAEPVLHQRSVLHLAWWEREAPGQPATVFYAPVFLVDGRYLGRHQVYNLSAFDPNPDDPELAALPAGLQHAVTLDGGRFEDAVVLGFVNPATQRFLAFEFRLVAGELSDLADKVEEEANAAGALYSPATMNDLSDRVGAALIDFGRRRFEPGLLGYLSIQVEAALSAMGPDLPGGALEMSDKIGAALIDFGARLFSEGGIVQARNPLLTDFLEVRPLKRHPSPQMTHTIRLRLISDRDLPPAAAGALAGSVILSEDAQQAVVSWEEEGQRLYVESDSDQWTEVRRLDPAIQGSGTTSQLLRQRVRER